MEPVEYDFEYMKRQAVKYYQELLFLAFMILGAVIE